MTITVISVTEIERDTWETRLQDPEWIKAEFAAIMTASGVRDSTTVAVAPRPDHRTPQPPAGPPWGPFALARARTRRVRTRVRSPPLAS